MHQPVRGGQVVLICMQAALDTCCPCHLTWFLLWQCYYSCFDIYQRAYCACAVDRCITCACACWSLDAGSCSSYSAVHSWLAGFSSDSKHPPTGSSSWSLQKAST
jgi:hypothetical protein